MRKLLFSAALTLMAAAALITLVVGDDSSFSEASSHRDAPLITEDPTADNTDVYAFVSTEEGRSDHVTLIANYIPLEEPGEGPNFYRFSDNVLYEIMVDVNGDAKEDLTYQFDFQTNVGATNDKTFLYSTGTIGPPDHPELPSSQYANWNQPTSYSLTEVQGDRRKSDLRTMLLQNARVAPINIGPTSVGAQEEYEALANFAIHTIGSGPGDIRVFAGPRDEGFYVDLVETTTFDAIDPRGPEGVDTTSGFNVHTIAIEVPKSRFMNAGDTDGVIGVWAASSRPKQTVLQPDGSAPSVSDKPVQVSRLGNPLVNEVLLPLSFKDRYNATQPKDDGANIADFIVNPGTSQGPFALIPVLNSLNGCTPTTGRVDLDLTLLKGIPVNIADLLDNAVPTLAPFTAAGGNQDIQQPGGPTTSDLLRLNFNVPPTASRSPLGFFGGDPAGFPNGRRVGDDVLDIDLKAAGGAILEVLGLADCDASLALTDNVDDNDVPYLSQFPYLGTPHQGFSHEHHHSNEAVSLAAMGMGLLGLVLALAVGGPKALGAVRRRIRA